MVFENIEKLKHEYTDKYVQVTTNRPELARFKDVVGQVRTVNMSGRALVEFSEYHLNTGWYDIDLDFLKVVAKPTPKVVAKKAAKPAGKSAAKSAAKPAKSGGKLSPLEMARMQGGPKPSGKKAAATSETPIADKLAAARIPQDADASAKADRTKMSVADMLASARGESSSAADPPAPAAAKKTAPAAKKADRSKMSVADMLASARGETTADSPAPTATEEPAAAEAPEVEEPAAETPVEAPAAPAASSSKVDRASMSVDDMVAWCREHDSE